MEQWQQQKKSEQQTVGPSLQQEEAPPAREADATVQRLQPGQPGGLEEPAKEAGIPSENGQVEEKKNVKETLYDKIPLTYKQVDILVKVLVALLFIALVIGIATGGLAGG